MRLRAKANASDASPITSMSHIKLPVMFVHGKDDRYVLPDNSLRLYEVCKSEIKELLMVEKRGMCVRMFYSQMNMRRRSHHLLTA